MVEKELNWFQRLLKGWYRTMIWLLFRKGYWKRLYLWVKYKYVLKLDIVGFYRGVPIIRSKYLVPESEIEL